MAFNNTEIEIKLNLGNADIEMIKDNISKVCKHKNSSEQIDTYFAPIQNNYLLEQFPFKWLSIRKRNAKTILNYKHFFPEGAEKHTHCKEYETELTDDSSMKSIFAELDIVEVVEVNKVREAYLFEDKYEIVLDIVKGLGNFLEIEAMKEMGNPENVKNEMMFFLQSLGIKDFEIDYRGYPFQILKNAGKI